MQPTRRFDLSRFRLPALLVLLGAIGCLSPGGGTDAPANVTGQRVVVEIPGADAQDLTETLARIERGEKLGFRNDGSVFQNREGRLPSKPRGWYREWVHPTPGGSGPGARRVVSGSDGAVWYTHDHYKSFVPVRRE